MTRTKALNIINTGFLESTGNLKIFTLTYYTNFNNSTPKVAKNDPHSFSGR